MQRIDKYFIQTDSEQEFNLIGNTLLSAYFNVSCYLKYLNSNESNALSNLFIEKAEILDYHNILIDYKQIKKELGIKGKFAMVQGKNIKSGDIKIDTACISYPNSKANKICQQIYSTLLYTIIGFDGKLIS